MDRFGPTGKVSEKRVPLLRWSSFSGRTGWNFGWMDRALSLSQQVDGWMLSKITEKIIRENAFEQKKKKPRLN